MTQQEKVAVLYRVSTEQQGTEDDIPMQRRECQQYAHNNGWNIVEEFVEKQSGYSTAIQDRESLVNIRNLAQEGKITIVLVYMSDRLGRQTEIAGFVQGLSMLGVKLYSVREGFLSGGSHSDTLMTYIRFWMAEGESMKTSQRVRDTMKQLNAQGFYVGGTAPFGYKLVDTGIKHNSKKNKTILMLAIDEDEAPVVQLIFDMVHSQGLGSSLIAKQLNSLGYTNRGKMFRHNTISRMLRNTIYIGYKRYNLTEQLPKSKAYKYLKKDEWKFQPYKPDLVIIDEDVFKRVQDILDSRISTEPSKAMPSPSHRGMLVTGILYCGKCGTKLKTDFSAKYHKKKDGQTAVYKVYRYICPNARNQHDHGKRQWGSKTLDKMVEEEMLHVIADIKMEGIEEEVQKYRDSSLAKIQSDLNQVQKQIPKAQKGLNNAKDELRKLMVGDSVFSKEDVSEMIDSFSAELEALLERESQLSNELHSNKVSLIEIEALKQKFSNFGDLYKQADFVQQKMLLASVIDRVVAYPDKVQIMFKIGIQNVLDIDEEKLQAGQMWFTGDNSGCPNVPLRDGTGQKTTPKKEVTMKDLLETRSIEFLVEHPWDKKQS